MQRLFAEGKQAVEAEGGGAGGKNAAVIRQSLYELVWPRWREAVNQLGAR